jgi:hypothetical protein
MSRTGRGACSRLFRPRDLLWLRAARAPGGKRSGQCWTMSMTRSNLARRELNRDRAGLPVLGDEVECRRDRFGYTVLGSPLGLGMIELDSVTIGGGVVGS